MSLEPVIYRNSEVSSGRILPNLPEMPRAGYYERKELGTQARKEVFLAQLREALAMLTMDGVTRLTRKQVAEQRRLAGELEAEMLATENPYLLRAMEEAFDNFGRTCREIVSRFGQGY